MYINIFLVYMLTFVLRFYLLRGVICEKKRLRFNDNFIYHFYQKETRRSGFYYFLLRGIITLSR